MEFDGWGAVHPLRPLVEENFTIDITEKWNGGVSFRYTVEDSEIGSGSGIQTLSSLDACTSIDPWWEPMETEYDDRCEFWIPPAKYWEIVTKGTIFLNVDTIARGDTDVRWVKTGKVHYPCDINGTPTLLDAIKIKTVRGDEIIILADPDNALILSIKSMYFAWKLRRVRN